MGDTMSHISPLLEQNVLYFVYLIDTQSSEGTLLSLFQSPVFSTLTDTFLVTPLPGLYGLITSPFTLRVTTNYIPCKCDMTYVFNGLHVALAAYARTTIPVPPETTKCVCKCITVKPDPNFAGKALCPHYYQISVAEKTRR